MILRLNPESKRAFLEQALRVKTELRDHSDLFVKLLVSIFF
jgi:hypothetical protein